ncbi:MAG TPA: hypothetical protein VNO26_02265 [Candidatus Limnocylindria bacterium]|nr:hypothetical protein [Candidatus Limnocylindria bacterium]
MRSCRIGGLVFLALALAGCEFWMSDNESVQRRVRAERECRLLEGRTHVVVFDRTPLGRRARHVEYRHYAAAGGTSTRTASGGPTRRATRAIAGAWTVPGSAC